MWHKNEIQIVDGKKYKAVCSGWWLNEKDQLVRNTALISANGKSQPLNQAA